MNAIKQEPDTKGEGRGMETIHKHPTPPCKTGYARAMQTIRTTI